MTDTFRALCAELVDAILTPNPYNWEDSLHDSANRARALLAQPVAEGPTDEDLEATAREAEVHYLTQQGGLGGDANNMAQQIQQQRIAGLRAVLARFGRPTPQPVADGEVAELCAWLRNNSSGVYRPAARAADLLERLASDNVGLAAAADSLWADNVSLLDN